MCYAWHTYPVAAGGGVGSLVDSVLLGKKTTTTKTGVIVSGASLISIFDSLH